MAEEETVRKTRVKILLAVAGVFMILTGVKETVPEFTATGYLLVGFLLLLVGLL